MEVGQSDNSQFTGRLYFDDEEQVPGGNMFVDCSNISTSLQEYGSKPNA